MVDGVLVDMTPEEIAQRQAEEAEAQKPKPLPLAEALDEDFKQNPAPIRAAFYTHKAAVKLALEQGDVEAAELIIQGVEVPPELAPAKERMLGKFKK